MQLWHAAVAALITLQAKYAAWFDALPEPLRDDAAAEALQAIVDLDELAGIEPPRGFGRDQEWVATTRPPVPFRAIYDQIRGQFRMSLDSTEPPSGLGNPRCADHLRDYRGTTFVPIQGAESRIRSLTDARHLPKFPPPDGRMAALRMERGKSGLHRGTVPGNTRRG